MAGVCVWGGGMVGELTGREKEGGEVGIRRGDGVAGEGFQASSGGGGGGGVGVGVLVQEYTSRSTRETTLFGAPKNSPPNGSGG